MSAAKRGKVIVITDETRTKMSELAMERVARAKAAGLVLRTEKQIARAARRAASSLQLIVDSTGLKLNSPGYDAGATHQVSSRQGRTLPPPPRRAA